MSEPVGDGAADTPDEAATRLRAVERRLRREKLALERLNPLEEPERYADALVGVVELEAERRDLKAAIAGADDLA